MTQEENKKSRSYQSGKAAVEHANSVPQFVERKKYCIEDFEAGVEWADENPKEGLVSIDKAANWLEMINLDYYQIREGVFSRELVTDFRKAMEE